MRVTINGQSFDVPDGGRLDIRLEVEPAGERLEMIDIVVSGGRVVSGTNDGPALRIAGEDGGSLVLYRGQHGDLYFADTPPVAEAAAKVCDSPYFSH